MASRIFGSRLRLGQLNLSGPEAKALRADPGHFADLIEVDENTGAFGHAYFLSNPAVRSDLVAMIRDRLKPGDPGRPLVEISKAFWRIPGGGGGSGASAAAAACFCEPLPARRIGILTHLKLRLALVSRRHLRCEGVAIERRLEPVAAGRPATTMARSPFGDRAPPSPTRSATPTLSASARTVSSISRSTSAGLKSLPTAVVGRDGAIRTRFGTAAFSGIARAACSRSSASVTLGAGLELDIGDGQFAGMGVRTADRGGSATAGCDCRASSISFGSMLWPPRMMSSFLRPVSQK